MKHSERQLRAWMTGGLDGDAASHEALLRALLPLLRAFYGARLRSREADIEDLVQETLIAVHLRRASYDRTRPFTPWLYAVARHRLIDHVRRRREVPVDNLEEILMAEGFEEAVAAQADVERLLGKLPPKQARAIRDTHVHGLSVHEAAEAAGIGKSDVKISVHRGLKLLAARIRGRK